jgi:hypothetical protein
MFKLAFLTKSKDEAWTGVVTRKGRGTNYDDDGEKSTYWTLDVKRDDTGKNTHYVVGRGQVTAHLFNALKEGDRVKKPAGTQVLEVA